MKTLTLSLKKQWFDMIKSGEKKEEYREKLKQESPTVYSARAAAGIYKEVA